MNTRRADVGSSPLLPPPGGKAGHPGKWGETRMSLEVAAGAHWLVQAGTGRREDSAGLPAKLAKLHRSCWSEPK